MAQAKLLSSTWLVLKFSSALINNGMPSVVGMIFVYFKMQLHMFFGLPSTSFNFDGSFILIMDLILL